MRNLAIALILFSFCNHSVFAFTKTKQMVDEPYFYCPNNMNYFYAGNFLDVNGVNNTVHWGNEIFSNDYETNKPILTPGPGQQFLNLEFSRAEVQENTPNSVVCHYHLTYREDPLLDFAVSIKEAVYRPYSGGQWKLGQCLSPDPKNCPIIEDPHLVIYNKDFRPDISVVINRREISQLPVNTYAYVTSNELNKYCVNQGTCLLEFYSDGLKLGSADVDFQSKIKLNSTFTIFKQYVIEQYIPFGGQPLNAITIRHERTSKQ